MDKRAFSFVEIIISISILVVLTIVATTATNNIKNNSNNSRVIADITTLKNGVTSYVNEGNNVPKPDGNNNFFKSDGSYVHEYSDAETFGAYGKVTENTLDNKYLNIIPLDPRTNQYYSFGVAKESNQFEIAGVIFNEEGHRAKVEGNYTGEAGIYNLIGEYNGNNFVIDKGPFLPYNPEEKLLTVKDENGNIYRQGDSIENNSGNDLEIYFSDGSTSIISDGTTITLSQMDFPKETNLVSKIKVFLDAGSIWTQATSLGEESSFDIFTSDTVASVRGTIFGVDNTSGQTEVVVEQGTVDVYRIPQDIDRENVIQPAIIDEIETIKTSPNYENEMLEVIDDGDIKGLRTDDSLQIDSDINLETSLSPPFSSRYSISTLDNTDIENNLDSEYDLEDENQIEGGQSCYLEGVEVKHQDKVKAYKSKVSDSCGNENNFEDRTCDNGELLGDNNYKYSSCTTNDSCPGFYSEITPDGVEYFVDNINDGLGLKIGDTTEEPIDSVTYPIPNGTRTHTRVLKCQGNNSYTVTEEENSVTCDEENGYVAKTNPTKNLKECVLDCDGTVIRGECINNNLGNDWKIYSTADYNSIGKIEMYDYSSKELSMDNGTTVVMDSCFGFNGGNCEDNDFIERGCIEYDKKNSYCKYPTGEKTIYLNLGADDDWIKYNIENIGEDYAVEISVKGSDLNRTGRLDFYSLFSTRSNNGNNFTLMLNDGQLKIDDKSDNSINRNFFHIPSYIEDNKFYSIILKMNDEEAHVELKTESGGPNGTKDISSSFNLEQLYVGSSVSEENQWGGMINYIRVYEKND